MAHHALRGHTLASLGLVAALALAGCNPSVEPQVAPPAGGASGPAVPASQAAVFPAALQALGNEPFWSVQVDGAQLRWSSPENIEGIGLTAQREDGDDGLYLRGQMAGQAVQLHVQAGSCSDGMSDTVYPWRATWTQGGTVFKGCARPPLAPE